VLEGECKIYIKDDFFRVVKGDIRIINPYELHRIDSSSWRHINLVVGADFVKSVLKEVVYFQNVIKDEKLFEYFKKLFNDESILTELQAKKALQKLSSYKKMEFERDFGKPKREYLEKIVKYIEKSADIAEIDIEKMVSKAGYSKYHFLREFKKEFGLTPNHYIHNVKINRARNLMDKNSSLSQVAYECGFCDQSHFIKIYKKFYGHTPSKIR